MGWPLTQAEYQTALNNPNIQLFPSSDYSEYEIAFNNNATDPSHTAYRKAMNYTEFRQAMACLVDKDGLISGPILNGFATRVDTQIPRPTMDNWVNFQDSKYASNGTLLNNYPWDYNETHALQILWNNGWYNYTTYPTLNSLLTAFSAGPLPIGSVVYPPSHPRAGQPIDSIVAYIRTNDLARKQAGDALTAEMEKIGINVTVNYVYSLSDARLPVFTNHDYDFYTAGYSMSNLPLWFSSYTPSDIYPDGPNIYMIQDANLTNHATLENNAPTYAQCMAEALMCQDIITQQAMFVPLYSTKSYYAYRTGWLDIVDTKGSGLQAALDYFMLAVQNQNPTVNSIRFGTDDPPDIINPIFGAGSEDYQVIDRIFTGDMNANPYNLMGTGKSPAGGDMPWMAYDWTFQLSNFTGWNPYNGLGNSTGPGTDIYGAVPDTSYTNCANCTYYFKDDITWEDGAPFTVDDFNYTLYLNNVYADAYNNGATGSIVNFVKIDNWTCSVYFNSPSYAMLYAPLMDVVPEHLYSYIAVPMSPTDNATAGASTTGIHGIWPGQAATASEILPGAPFTWSDLNSSDGGKYVWIGTGMWRYQAGTYTGGVGGGIELSANRNFFLYAPPTGEIDFNYYWNPGSAPQTGCYKIDLNDLALLNDAFGSTGNPPSANWDPRCDIAAPPCKIDQSDVAALQANFGVQWGYVPSTAQSSTSVTCSPNPVSAGSPVNCIATVSGSNATGNVTWSTSSIGGSFGQSVCPLSVYGNCSTMYVENFTGCVTIAASYSGDSNNAPSSGSFTLTVTSVGPVYYTQNYTSVQAAINAAPAGANVIVTAGFYNGSLTVNETLTIIGEKDVPVFSGGASGVFMNLLSGASGTIVTGIEISNFAEAILVQNASNCRIYDNIISSITGNGIVLQGSSATGNLVFGNAFQETPTPINLTASANGNTIYGNIISCQNTVTLNIGANANSLYDNTVQGSQIIVNMTSTTNNLIYNNNFVATSQITVFMAGGNSWNASYPTGGNYWSDYQSRYPGASEIGNSGIWNTPYVIDGSNRDYYPLMNPWVPMAGHDVAVLGVVAAKTVIGKGYTGNLTISFANNGVYTESFGLTAYANATIIYTSQIGNMGSASQASLTFKWDTSSLAYGNYTVSAWAWPVPGETDVSNNNFTLGVIKVTIPGDLNGDFKVSLSDLTILAKAYGSHCANYDYQGEPASPKWNANADINGDGKVSLSDLQIMAKNYGKSATS
jgi:parallel beta-helix repeat protein